MSKNKLGLLFGISAYSLWGAFPLYWPLLEPANALEIVSHRAVWTLVFCFIVQVCDKNTGHAEVCQIVYDTTKISLDDILAVFWKTHDPTTPNQQGNDVGPQYRSAVFYHNEHQKEVAEAYIKALNESKAWPNPIITEVTAFSKFYSAESYHQNYYNDNPNQGYCRYVVGPKVEKFEKVFADKLKKQKD